MLIPLTERISSNGRKVSRKSSARANSRIGSIRESGQFENRGSGTREEFRCVTEVAELAKSFGV